MNLKMSEVADLSGFTRQWISREAAKGNVPGAQRKESGRWAFKRSAELEKWMADCGRKTRILKRKRYLHSDEARVHEMRAKIAKIQNDPRARVTRKRLNQLRQELQARQDAVTDSMTTKELAEKVRRSPRWVSMHAASIPGFKTARNGFAFEKSEKLSEWIHSERRLTKTEKTMLAGDMKLPRDPWMELHWATSRYESVFIRTLNRYPLEDWSASAKQGLKEKLHNLLTTIEQFSQGQF